MLSRLRMSIGECLENFTLMASMLFEHERKISVFGFPRPKYSRYNLAADLFDDIISQKTPSDSGHLQARLWMFPSPPDLCRT